MMRHSRATARSAARKDRVVERFMESPSMRLARNQDSRYSSLSGASYASPALDTTDLPPERAPARSARFRPLTPSMRRPVDVKPHFCFLLSVILFPFSQAAP